MCHSAGPDGFISVIYPQSNTEGTETQSQRVMFLKHSKLSHRGGISEQLPEVDPLNLLGTIASSVVMKTWV